MIPLEDNVSDIIGKAQRGLRISDTELAEKARVSSQKIRKLREGDFDELALLRVAPVLGLAARALCELAKNEWHPKKIDERDGLAQIDTRLTCGHSSGGMTYVVNGLAPPIAIVGDSIFAGSMGGGNVSYDDALRNNLKKILTLPDETIICPGHGPMTTVGEEKQHNPFFAGQVD